jgi:hypothetical protein
MTAPSDAGALTPLCLTHLPTPLAASRSTARCGGLLHVGCKPLKSRKSSTVLFPLLKIYSLAGCGRLIFASSGDIVGLSTPSVPLPRLRSIRLQ